MQNFITFIRSMTVRHWAIFFTIVPALLLGTALISQYGFGMMPCKLCLWQRVPYGVAIALGIALFFMVEKQPFVKIILGLIIVTFLGNAGLALFHVGVEYKWWTFNSECVNEIFKPKATIDEMLASLRAAPVVRCDERHPFLFGMTMAFYNIVVCLGLAVIGMIALFLTQRSSSLSQYK